MYKISSVEDQYKFIVPINRISEQLYYNQKMIIDNIGVNTEPRAWTISKVNRINFNGTIMFTLAQTRFDQHNDYIERDEEGNIIGMWADYYKNNITPTNPPEDETTWLQSEITCSGVRPFLKVFGGYKTLTVNFKKNFEEVKPLSGDWFYTIADTDVSSLIVEKKTDQDNQIKIKFTGDESYIGQTLVVSHITDKTKSSIELPIESI